MKHILKGWLANKAAMPNNKDDEILRREPAVVEPLSRTNMMKGCDCLSVIERTCCVNFKIKI